MAIDIATIQVDGSIEFECVENGCEPLQRRVGGWIEAVYSSDGEVTLWINEEGKLTGLEPNMVGTELWWLLNPATRGMDVLHGPVVVSGGADSNGDTLPIPGGIQAMLKAAVAAADE